MGTAGCEDGTLRRATGREGAYPRGGASQAWKPGAAIVAVAAILAQPVLAGCAAQAEDPAPAQTVAVPESSGETAEGRRETITIDPNVVSYDEYHDPLMPLNRFVFRFNDVVARYALVPLGKGYARVVPEAVDQRVDNFFSNAASPVYAVNNLLQAEPRLSARNLARFGINTTVGLLGLFDPADAWFGLERAESDFAATLAHYDAGYGIYLVLPFFGASDSRNATARVVDYFLHPIPWLLDQPESFFVLSYGFFHEFAQTAEDYEELLKQSEDPYIFVRNLHLQSVQRDAAYR